MRRLFSLRSGDQPLSKKGGQFGFRRPVELVNHPHFPQHKPAIAEYPGIPCKGRRGAGDIDDSLQTGCCEFVTLFPGSGGGRVKHGLFEAGEFLSLKGPAKKVSNLCPDIKLACIEAIPERDESRRNRNRSPGYRQSGGNADVNVPTPENRSTDAADGSDQSATV